MQAAGRLTPLALQHLRERWGRSLLTGLGVAMGVALFVGAMTTTRSITGSLDAWVEETKGLTDLAALPAGRGASSAFGVGGTGTLLAADVERVRGLDGVVDATGFFGFPTTIESAAGKQTNLAANVGADAALLGADFEAARRLYGLSLSAGGLPAEGAQGVIVTPALASRLDIAPGDELEISGATGNNRFIVEGVLEERGLGRIGDVAFTSLPAAWSLAGERDVVGQIAIRLADDVDSHEWAAAHDEALGAGVRLVPASRAIDQQRQSLALIGGALTVLSVGVVFLAGFLVYLTLSMSVVERLQLYGLLSAIGATAAQIRRLVVAEAVGLGLLGSAVGSGIGLFMAWALLQLGGRLTGPVDLVVTPAALALGVVTGIGITTASAWLPARRAARIDAVAAIRGDYESLTPRVMPAVVGGVLAVVGGVGLLLSGDNAVLSLALPALLLGSILVLPWALRPLAPLVGRVTALLSPGGGDVAVLHLAKERTRSAYTLALVMVAIALAFAAGITRTSFIESFDESLDRNYGRDFDVVAPDTFAPGFTQQVAAVEGVGVASPQNFAIAQLRTAQGDEDVQMRMIDPQSYPGLAGFDWRDGTYAQARQGLMAGDSVVFPSTSADRLGLAAGDTVSIVTTEGPVEFRIAATAFLPNALPDVYLNRDAGRRYFGIHGPEVVAVTVAGGHDSAQVATRVEQTLGDDVTFIVATVDDIKADVRSQIDAGVSGFLFLLVMAGVVGLFGLANTLAVSMIRRFREIGILRAIGARRRQVAAMALVESLTLVAVAFVFAVPLGALIARPLIATFATGLGDLGVGYHYPWTLLPALAVAGLAIAALASVWPARRAARLEIDAALRFD